MRRELKENVAAIVEPVRKEAQELAGEEIRNVGKGKPWAQMRSAVTRRFAVAYVAPVKRGVKRADDPRRRPNLADLLRERAMEPALVHNSETVEHEVQLLVDKVTRGW